MVQEMGPRLLLGTLSLHFLERHLNHIYAWANFDAYSTPSISESAVSRRRRSPSGICHALWLSASVKSNFGTIRSFSTACVNAGNCCFQRCRYQRKSSSIMSPVEVNRTVGACSRWRSLASWHRRHRELLLDMALDPPTPRETLWSTSRWESSSNPFLQLRH